MANHTPRHLSTRTTTATTAPAPTFLRRIQHHASNSPQLFGISTLFITVAVLLLLAGVTVTEAVLLLILFSPLLILLSPLWVPPCVLLFLVVAGFLSMCGFGVVLTASLTWAHRYVRRRGRKRVSDRLEYPPSRFVPSAGSHSRDYVREYEYVKYVAPGA